MGNLFFGLLTGFNHTGSFGHLDPVAVDLNIHQTFLGSEVLRRVGVVVADSLIGMRGDYESQAFREQADFVKFFTKSDRAPLFGAISAKFRGKLII